MTKPTSASPLTFSDLTHARRIAAQLVENLGDEYWPAFDCLYRELESRRGRENRLQNALSANLTLTAKNRTAGLLEPPKRAQADAPCLPQSGN